MKKKTIDKKDDDRDTKIFNVLCNSSILLMAIITDSFSEIFANLSKEMITSLTKALGTAEDDTRKIDDLQKDLPDHLRKELLTMKNDLIKQLSEKRQELSSILSDPRFDTGVSIVERTSLPLPKLTKVLDERSLLGYLTLLQTNDPKVTTMFQELLEWMKTLPKPETKEK